MMASDIRLTVEYNKNPPIIAIERGHERDDSFLIESVLFMTAEEATTIYADLAAILRVIDKDQPQP